MILRAYPPKAKPDRDDEGRAMQTAVARRRVLMSPDEIDRAIARMAHQIVEPEDAQNGLILVGIRRGGEALARRLASKIAEIRGSLPQLGFLNVNLYRDDDVARELPESEIRSGITGQTVVLVDDVLYTGRTVRAALDAVTDLGRPRAIRLAVLVDRGLRELPVQPDYVGKMIPTSRRERIDVLMAAQRSDADVVTVHDDDRAAP
jgi:pyrimidine operon attenuation protein / uracil phosphoribosyltransferase